MNRLFAVVSTVVVLLTLGCHDQGSSIDPPENEAHAVPSSGRSSQSNHGISQAENRARRDAGNVVVPKAPPADLPKENVNSIAVREVAARSNCDVRQLRAEAELDGDLWKVLVRKVPAKPGGFWYVYVTKKGTVKQVVGGE